MRGRRTGSSSPPGRAWSCANRHARRRYAARIGRETVIDAGGQARMTGGGARTPNSRLKANDLSCRRCPLALEQWNATLRWRRRWCSGEPLENRERRELPRRSGCDAQRGRGKRRNRRRRGSITRPGRGGAVSRSLATGPIGHCRTAPSPSAGVMQPGYSWAGGSGRHTWADRVPRRLEPHPNQRRRN